MGTYNHMVVHYNLTDSPNSKFPSVVITLSPSFRPEIIATLSSSVIPTSTTRTSTVLFSVNTYTYLPSWFCIIFSQYIYVFAVLVFANRFAWYSEHLRFYI